MTLVVTECQEAHCVLNFLCVASLFSSRIKGSNTSTRPQWDSVYLWRWPSLKTRWFCVAGNNPKTVKNLKNAINIDFFDSSNCYFSAILTLNASIKISITRPFSIKYHSTETLLILVLASKPWMAKASRTLLLKLIHLGPWKGVFRDYSFYFFMGFKFSDFTLRGRDSIQISLICLFATNFGHCQ